jgi:hypothetical protein
LRKEHRLKEVEIWVLWKICGPKSYEARGRWRRLYEELYDLDFTPSIVCVMKLRKMR